MMRVILILALVASAAPAHAAFIGAAITAISGALAGVSALTLAVGRLVLSVAVSAYQKRRMKKKLGQQSGITTQFVGTGGTTPLTMLVGRYATNGHLEAPQMSHPDSGSPPNRYLTYVIGLGDVPITGLTGRVIINDAWATIGSEIIPGPEPVEADFAILGAFAPSFFGKAYREWQDSVRHALFGRPVLGPLAGTCWFRFRDGTHTTVDPMLLTTFGAYPERPWTEDMIGRGIPHVICTFDLNRELFPGEPRLRFECLGAKFYDPRKDSTVGGTGAHRWADKATWEWTENPKVIEYNIHRGITIDGFGVWGNVVPAEDLPLDNWFAAMNACDLPVDNGSGGTEPSFVFGFEWSLDTEPRVIIDEINRSCGGETVEIAGVWKTRVGGIGLPVYFFTDADILVTRAQEMDPFPGLEETFNAFSCSFPDPDILWEAREAPPLTNEAWEIEDGALEWDASTSAWVRRPRRLLREVSLPAVSNPRQVQRLIASSARQGRKRISHSLPLPPAALMLEPLDAVAWTSARHGYNAKIFEVVMTADPVTALRPSVGLIEADPADFTPPVYVALPVPSTQNPAFGLRIVEGFSVEPFVVSDAAGNPRRPGLRLTWDAQAMAEVRGLSYEVRVAVTAQVVAHGSVQRAADGEVIVGDLLPSTNYQVRARAASDRPTVWTDWASVTTPAAFIGAADIAEGAINFRIGYGWSPLSPTVTLTPAAPSNSLGVSAQMGTFAEMKGGMAVLGIEATLTAAAPRAVRMRIGSAKGAQLDQVQWLVPGQTMRLVATGAVLDRPAGGGTIVVAPTIDAIGLLAGESILVIEARAEINYWRR